VVDNSYVPPVVLTDFQLFGKPAAIGARSPLNHSIASTKSLTLSATENVFSVEFSALSYVSPEENRYRYRLEGLETEWNETSSEHRLVTYTTLPPGDYVFHVQGSNNRGLWNEKGVALSLRILPPWWSTWWFRTILVASLLLSVWCVYYLRVQSVERRQAEIRALNEQLIKAQEAERMRIAGELHDSILQNITSLSIRLGTVKYQVPLDAETSANISGLQQELIRIGTDVRQISHELHPTLLQEAGLPTALSSYCEEFSKVRGLPVSCTTDENVKELSPGAALCIYRIAQEALGNAGKYSKGTKVEVQLTRSDGRVCLCVSDDGVGCVPSQIGKSQGLGLINMRERVLQLDGTFEFDSKPGHGTTVKIGIPFRPASQV
jgi:signal transduction histidine kinase